MGAGVSAEQFKGKSREELLTLCFKHIDRYNEDKASLGNLMCMADDLSPAEIEQVRSDFVRIDRHSNGYILQEDYTEYYIKQLADVDDDEFRMFVQSVLNSAHWPERQLQKNNCVTMGNEKAKEDAERELLEQQLEEQRIETFNQVQKQRKASTKRVNMIARGEGSMVEWVELAPKKNVEKLGRFKARMMVLGHFGAKHTQQKAASSWARR